MIPVILLTELNSIDIALERFQKSIGYHNLYTVLQNHLIYE